MPIPDVSKSLTRSALPDHRRLTAAGSPGDCAGPLVACEADSAFHVGAVLVRIGAAANVIGQGLRSFIDRPSAKIGHAATDSRCELRQRRFRAIVGLVFRQVGIYQNLCAVAASI